MDRGSYRVQESFGGLGNCLLAKECWWFKFAKLKDVEPGSYLQTPMGTEYEKGETLDKHGFILTTSRIMT